jgi:hypothetical protein
MRSDIATRQANKLEAILSKALLNMPAGATDEHTANTVAEISECLLEAYALGGLEALERAPWEYHEVADRERPEVAHLNRQGALGWEAWTLTEVMIPAPAGATSREPTPGWLVRYKRRRAPMPGAANEA